MLLNRFVWFISMNNYLYWSNKDKKTIQFLCNFNKLVTPIYHFFCAIILCTYFLVYFFNSKYLTTAILRLIFGILIILIFIFKFFFGNKMPTYLYHTQDLRECWNLFWSGQYLLGSWNRCILNFQCEKSLCPILIENKYKILSYQCWG